MAGEDVIYELAAMLGSIKTFDRHGWVVWMDGFEDGLARKWRTATNDTILPVESTEAARHGEYSAKFETAAEAESSATIFHDLPLPVESKVGLEVSFSIKEHVSAIQIQLHFYDGVTFSHGDVQYLPGSTKWQYLDSAGHWQDLFTDVALLEYPQCFHTVKVVLDYATDEYVRVLANENMELMPGVGIYSVDSELTPRMGVAITVKTDDANAAIAYVDDVIVTQNEP